MSLINKMLIDLEERQACLAGEQDVALQGISSVNDPTFQNQNKYGVYLLAFIAFLLSGVIVNMLYQNLNNKESNTIPVSDVTGKVEVTMQDSSLLTDSTAEQASSNVSSLPSSPGANNSAEISLKLDTVFRTSVVEETSISEDVSAPTAIEPKSVVSVKPLSSVQLSISDFELQSHQTRTVFSVMLTAEPDYAVYALPNPDRVVIEINNIQEKSLLPQVQHNELVSGVRARYQGKSRALIVLDMFNTSSILGSEVMALRDGYELVVTAVSELPTQELATLEPSDQELDRQLKEHGLTGSVANQAHQTAAESRMVKRTRKAVDYFDDGLQMYHSGNGSDAADLFNDALKIEPGHIDARSMLVSLMMEEGNRYRAAELLKGGLAIHPGQHEWTVTFAHILVEQGKLGAAVDILQRQPPKLADNLEYHAFLAALLQQQGKHEAATDSYRQLLDRKANNGVWWMGLGISLQALAKTSDAGLAYRKALRDPTLSMDLRNYIARQLSQL